MRLLSNSKKAGLEYLEFARPFIFRKGQVPRELTREDSLEFLTRPLTPVGRP